jgi:hypothetical protein
MVAVAKQEDMMASQYVVQGIAVAGFLCAFAGPFLLLYAAPASTPGKIPIGLCFAGILYFVSMMAGAVEVLPQNNLVALAAAMVGFVAGTFAPRVVGGDVFRYRVGKAGLTLLVLGVVTLFLAYALQHLGITGR